jgi:A/G-specific adenine glycosylase
VPEIQAGDEAVNEEHPLTILLCTWYAKCRRDLPWRKTRDPYPIWLSEVILQQTRVDQGLAYWERFLAEFPRVEDLARADSERVMKLWQGLGYYSRARNVHKAAQAVAAAGGRFPSCADELRDLPGVGPYTAAAVASICYNEPVAAVDGNVIRVVSRIFDLELPVDRAPGRAAVEGLAQAMVNRNDPGTSNQAMMELGAMVCSPKAPKCTECPVASGCLAAARGTALERPVKHTRTRVKNVHFSFALHLHPSGGQVWMERRPASGIWGDLWSLPFIETADEPQNNGLEAKSWGPFKHELSHRRITAWCHLSKQGVEGAAGRWVGFEDVGEYALHRLMDRMWEQIGPEIAGKR